MKQNILETFVGLIVLIIAFTFLFYSLGTTQNDSKGTYLLNARFESVEGLVNGTDICIGGIVVGKVTSMKLDTQTYTAILNFAINDDIHIPKDSRAAVVSSGFLGGKYIAITPGGDEEYLESGDSIKFTQSSINLESLIGKFMYSGPSSSK